MWQAQSLQFLYPYINWGKDCPILSLCELSFENEDIPVHQGLAAWNISLRFRSTSVSFLLNHLESILIHWVLYWCKVQEQCRRLSYPRSCEETWQHYYGWGFHVFWSHSWAKSAKYYLQFRALLNEARLLDNLHSVYVFALLCNQLVASSKTTFTQEVPLDVLSDSVALEAVILDYVQIFMRWIVKKVRSGWPCTLDMLKITMIINLILKEIQVIRLK